jgi:16S rRNA (cytosine967-C5)-methyltransferase
LKSPESRSKPSPTTDRTAGLATRRVALEILLRVTHDQAFADVLLGHELPRFSNPADRRLVTELVLGTIAWQARLDYELGRFASRPLTELERSVHAILRMGLYQLRKLTRMPPHAVVDTAVRLASETADGRHVKGFVNAILRTALRSDVPLPDRDQDELEYLAVAHSHPRWLVAKFVEWFGVADTESLLSAHNRAAPNVLRLNLARAEADVLIAALVRDGLTIERRGLFPETVFLKGAPRFDCPSYRTGLFVPQAEASQLITHLLAPSPGSTVIDCAAAPGGKSTHLAEMVGTDGQIISLDYKSAGLRDVCELARRLRHRNVFTIRCDSSVAIPVRPDSVSSVLLDAPCTGLGTLREHPEIRWRLRPDDFARMGRLQSRMLHLAAELVRRGGVIVYAVCSLAPEEGDRVVAEFLADHREFVVDRPPSGPLKEIIRADGFMCTRPDREARDGFFAARLKRL